LSFIRPYLLLPAFKALSMTGARGDGFDGKNSATRCRAWLSASREKKQYDQINTAERLTVFRLTIAAPPHVAFDFVP
jgi:hypothetical protein